MLSLIIGSPFHVFISYVSEELWSTQFLSLAFKPCCTQFFGFHSSWLSCCRGVWSICAQIFTALYYKWGQANPVLSSQTSYVNFLWELNLSCGLRVLSILSGFWIILRRFPVTFGEGNGSPLQYSCLENPRDGGAWWAAIRGVAQSRTRLKRLSSSSQWRSQRVDNASEVFCSFNFFMLYCFLCAHSWKWCKRWCLSCRREMESGWCHKRHSH